MTSLMCQVWVEVQQRGPRGPLVQPIGRSGFGLYSGGLQHFRADFPEKGRREEPNSRRYECRAKAARRSDNSNLRKETMNLATLFPAGSFSWTDVSALCLERGVHSVWGDRIRDMALHASSACLSVAGCTRPTANFTRVRVTRKDWPSVGSITLDRADGSRWKLHMTPKTRKFKVTRMN